MHLLNQCIGIPLPDPADSAALASQAALWRAAIVCAMVHVGTEPKVPPPDTPPFPLPSFTTDTAHAQPYASGAPLVTACPLIAVGSENDRLWPVSLMARWSDVSGPLGFRRDEIDGVQHFKLMTSEPVVEVVERELCAAALVQARFR